MTHEEAKLVHPAVPCTSAELFTFHEGNDSEEIADFVRQADKYLSVFAAPVIVNGNRVCMKCGGIWDGLKAALGLGVGAEWGLTHGEAFCSDPDCRWPCRGMHYPKREDGTDLFTLRNFFLQYMPEAVNVRTQGTQEPVSEGDGRETGDDAGRLHRPVSG